MQLAARRACSKTSDLRSSDGSYGRYYRMYHALNRKRNGIVSAGEVSLWEKEQEAWAKTTGRVHPNADRISPLSHKTIATLALPLGRN